MTIANTIKHFLLFCSGATREILQQKGCEIEHNKYAGIGATILFTAILASLSGGYAMFTVFHSTSLSVAFGLLWGLIIFNLDRFIVSSVRKKRLVANLTLGKQFGLKMDEVLKALPRLILAIFISIVITRPIELKLFEVEVQGQTAKDLIQERTRIENEVKTEFADIDKSELDNERLRERLVELQNEWNRRVKVAAGELDGWGGTGSPGDGTEYKKRQAEAKQAEAELNSFKAQYGPVLETREWAIDKRKTQRNNRIEEAKREIDNSRGLLRRLEALSQLTTSHWAIFFASGFILLLFISLETAPLIVKLFSSRGPYDDYLDASEQETYARQQQKISDVNDEINTNVALSKQINAGRLKAELQLSQSTMASLHTLVPQEIHAAQVEIARKAVDEWKIRQLNRAASIALTMTPSVLTTGPANQGLPGYIAQATNAAGASVVVTPGPAAANPPSLVIGNHGGGNPLPPQTTTPAPLPLTHSAGAASSSLGVSAAPSPSSPSPSQQTSS